MEFGEEIPRYGSSIVDIIRSAFNGPQTPSDDFPTLSGPISVIDNYEFTVEKRTYWLLSWIFTSSLIVTYCTMLYVSLFSALGYRGPELGISASSDTIDFPIIEIPCGVADFIWSEDCGINGVECIRKFMNEEVVIVKCPAFCDKGSLAFSPIVVQDRKIQYEPFLVQGSDSYRGDSFPCAVGLKEGLISSEFGGVMGLQLKNGFSDQQGDDHAFPASFDAFKIDKKHVYGPYWDYRWYNIIVHVFLMLLASFIVQSNFLFYAIFTSTSFIIVGFLFDPAIIIRDGNLENDNNVWSLISLVIGRLTISIFMFKCLWDWVFKYMFYREKTPIIRVILVLSIIPTLCYNATIDRLPIDRLVWSDILAMKGGLITVICLFGILTFGACLQAWAIWKAGWLNKAVIGYISLIIILLLISLQSNLKIRLHHWIIGILLLPGCKTRSQLFSYIFIGFLLGLIINGIARWGFASIIESTGNVIRDKHTTPNQIQSIVLNSNIADAIGVENSDGIRWWFNDIFIGGNVEQIEIPFENGYLRVSKGLSSFLVAKIESNEITNISVL